MSPKQLYFTILSFIITIVIIIAGVFFVRQQQADFAAVNVLTYLYNEVGKEMTLSAKSIEIDQFQSWLSDSENKDLLDEIDTSSQEYLYCPSKSGDSFYMAWVKNLTKLKIGPTECYSTSRGKISVTLDCSKALVCIKSN